MSNSEAIPLIPNTPPPSRIGLAICIQLTYFAISIAEITIGALYLDDCPLQPYIPIYLIVKGTFILMRMFLSCLPCAKKPEDGATNPLYSVYSMWNFLVSLFLFCWFITGTVWIFSTFKPSDNNSTNVDPYCNRTLYLFAMCIFIMNYFIIILFLFRHLVSTIVNFIAQ